MTRASPRPVWLLALLCLGACHLIDQESFGAAPRPPAPDLLQAALQSNGAAPLVTLHPDRNPAYAAALDAAIEAARDKQGVTYFHVLAVAPPGPSLAATEAALRRASRQAEPVIDAMAEDGVAPERVSLKAATRAGIDGVRIEVFAGK